jgi:hypothetical protein
MTARAAQLEQVARLMYFAGVPPVADEEGWWGVLLSEHKQNPRSGSLVEVALQRAEIALSFAEATREAAAKWHEIIEEYYSTRAMKLKEKENSLGAAHLRALAKQHAYSSSAIRAMPLPIAGAGAGAGTGREG